MGKSIAQIKEELENANADERKILLQECSLDERKGVQKIVAQYHKKELELSAEKDRLEKMKFFENKYNQYEYICGIDEAGRGPLAGPVVAGACILPKDATILYLNDSKKVNEKRRELLYDEICEKAIAYGIGIVSPERIDQINILQATYEAMQQAIANMKITPDLLLVDAVNIPKITIKQVGIVKGDAKSVSIAAASILAKVTRDRIMREFDSVYPEYDFAKNKGYGSKKHIETLEKIGKCPIHRDTFIKNFVN